MAVCDSCAVFFKMSIFLFLETRPCMFHWMTLVLIKDLSMGFVLGGTGEGREEGWVNGERVVGMVCTEGGSWSV